LEANFLVAAGLSNGFFTSNLLRAMAENTALVISVTEFGAVRPDAAAHPRKSSAATNMPRVGARK